MIDDRGVTHYDQMPIPPVESQTTYFEAGVVTFGVEFRLLDDAIAAASATEDAKGNTSGTQALQARFHHDDDGIRRAALEAGQR